MSKISYIRAKDHANRLNTMYKPDEVNFNFKQTVRYADDIRKRVKSGETELNSLLEVWTSRIEVMVDKRETAKLAAIAAANSVVTKADFIEWLDNWRYTGLGSLVEECGILSDKVSHWYGYLKGFTYGDPEASNLWYKKLLTKDWGVLNTEYVNCIDGNRFTLNNTHPLIAKIAYDLGIPYYT